MRLLQCISLACIAALAACAREDGSDELMEDASRTFHSFNMRTLRRIEPSVMEYRAHHSQPAHDGFVNFFANLREPLTTINSVLGLDFTNAAKSVSRFVINSTAGALGAFDVAGDIGIKRDKRDFGEMLGSWGVPEGAFFSLPLAGPTNVRDFSGGVVDSVIDPTVWVFGWFASLAITAGDKAFSVYDGYDFIIGTDESALDSYTAFKSMYQQNRRERIARHLIFFDERPRLAYDFDM